ncbi:MAG: biotin/lipoyl-binding protein, partial [Chloroflexi bacterium]|nr:biotin/lipoyl-binding protein [Chloroflexota bacterium]
MAVAAAALLLTMLAAGCAGRAGGKDQPIVAIPPPVVQVARPQRRTVDRVLDLPGSVEAYQYASLYARVPGYLRTVLVDRGDRVQAGQLLAVIDAPEMHGASAQAEEAARAQVASAAAGPANVQHAQAEHAAAEAAADRAAAEYAAAGSQ